MPFWLLSPSLRGRGLKFRCSRTICWFRKSPSLRGRGLKSSLTVIIGFSNSSPSLRGRGLKCNLYDTSELVDEVALFTRAWIEIIFSERISISVFVALFTRAWIEIAHFRYWGLQAPGRPLYEGVDWNSCDIFKAVRTTLSPSLRGRGLKFPCDFRSVYCSAVALFTRAWIEILAHASIIWSDPVALFTRAWIEIANNNCSINRKLSPSSRGRGLK